MWRARRLCALPLERRGVERIGLGRFPPQAIPARDVRVDLTTCETHERLYSFAAADLMDVRQTSAIYAGADQRHVFSLPFAYSFHIICEERHFSQIHF